MYQIQYYFFCFERFLIFIVWLLPRLWRGVRLLVQRLRALPGS